MLSFSNVAVDTFRQSYQSLIQEMSVGIGGHRVDIDTLDGFITRNVLRPHAHRTMQATQAAFLVTGDESFLNGFAFKPGNSLLHPAPVYFQLSFTRATRADPTGLSREVMPHSSQPG